MFRVSSVADLEQVLTDFRMHHASVTEASDQKLPESFVCAEPSPAL
jgi:hypothetical protein